MNQRQLQVIDYLREENRVLRDRRGGGRLRLDDQQRRRLAVKAKLLGQRVLAKVAAIVTPRLRWLGMKLVAQKHDGSTNLHRGDLHRRRGRGFSSGMAEENRDWDSGRIAPCPTWGTQCPSTVAQLPERQPAGAARIGTLIRTGFVRGIELKEPCWERLILFGEDSLRKLRKALSR